MLARRVNKKVNGPKNQKISEKEDKKILNLNEKSIKIT